MSRTPMNFTALSLALGLLAVPAACTAKLAGTPSPVAPVTVAQEQPQGVADLQVRFTSIKQQRGFIMMALYNSEVAYDGGGRSIASMRIPVTGAEATAQFPGLAPGDYALRAFHDIDGDGKMGENLFGIPTEPFAFSNNAPAMMGPAKWAAARFAAPVGASVHTVTID